MTDDAPNESILFAIYDVATQPAAFDIVNFVMLAEIERRERGLKSLHVVFTAADNGPLDRHRHERGWRLRQIVMPVCRLIPACAGMSVFTKEDEARAILERRRAFFPNGFSADRETQRFRGADLVVACSRGREIPSFKPQGQAVSYARQWIASHAGGRKIITFTLSEAHLDGEPTRDLAEWRAFIDTLDRDAYMPVILGDVETMFGDVPPQLEGIAQCPVTAVNLEIGAALYQESYLNLFAGWGRAAICIHTQRARCLVFRPPAVELGIQVGDQIPYAKPFQRLVWEAETAAAIRNAFDEMVACIETQDRAIPSPEVANSAVVLHGAAEGTTP